MIAVSVSRKMSLCAFPVSVIKWIFVAGQSRADAASWIDRSAATAASHPRPILGTGCLLTSVDNSLQRRHEGCLPPGDPLACALRQVRPSTASSRSTSSACASSSFTRASARRTRSTIDLGELLQPPRAGRPLERERVAPYPVGSKSPSAHQAVTSFPAFCRTVPRSTRPHARSAAARRAPPRTRAAQPRADPRPARPRPLGSTTRRRPSARRTARPDGRAAPRARRPRAGTGVGLRSAWASRSQPT